jgi:plastocyanin domain-containing protein
VLVVTRRTEQTCAKEIVIEGQEMRRALPLNQAIEIRLSAKKARTLRFACGMDMLGGTVVIE